MTTQMFSQNNAIYPGPDILSNVNDLGDDQAPKTVNTAPDPENLAPGQSTGLHTRVNYVSIIM